MSRLFKFFTREVLINDRQTLLGSTTAGGDFIGAHETSRWLARVTDLEVGLDMGVKAFLLTQGPWYDLITGVYQTYQQLEKIWAFGFHGVDNKYLHQTLQECHDLLHQYGWQPAETEDWLLSNMPFLLDECSFKTESLDQWLREELGNEKVSPWLLAELLDEDPPLRPELQVLLDNVTAATKRFYDHDNAANHRRELYELYWEFLTEDEWLKFYREFTAGTVDAADHERFINTLNERIATRV